MCQDIYNATLTNYVRLMNYTKINSNTYPVKTFIAKKLEKHRKYKTFKINYYKNSEINITIQITEYKI